MSEPQWHIRHHDGLTTYAIEFFDDARTYPVTRELLVEWTETLNVAERLRAKIKELETEIELLKWETMGEEPMSGDVGFMTPARLQPGRHVCTLPTGDPRSPARAGNILSYYQEGTVFRCKCGQYWRSKGRLWRTIGKMRARRLIAKNPMPRPSDQGT